MPGITEYRVMMRTIRNSVKGGGEKMIEWEKEMGLKWGEEGHGCHGMLVRMLTLPWWQEGKARAVGGSHETQRQVLEEDATNPLRTTDLPDGGMERKGGQEDEADCKLHVCEKMWLRTTTICVIGLVCVTAPGDRGSRIMEWVKTDFCHRKARGSRPLTSSILSCCSVHTMTLTPTRSQLYQLFVRSNWALF